MMFIFHASCTHNHLKNSYSVDSVGVVELELILNMSSICRTVWAAWYRWYFTGFYMMVWWGMVEMI